MDREYEDFEGRRRRRQAEKRRKKKRAVVLLAALLALAVVLAVAVPILNAPKLALGETVTVTIPEGSNTKTIAKALKENKVISNELMFLLAVKTSAYKGKLRYGTFTFSGGMDTEEIIRTLAQEGAKKDTITVTIPEGYSIERIIKKCVESGLSSAEEFEAAMKAEYDFDFIRKIPEKEGQKYRLQGFLFPSTYEFYQNASAQDVVKTMLAEFEKQYLSVSQNWEGVYDVVTKASLIQRESKLASENATIAGVIENRLKAGMRLQIDASVVYAITNGQYDVTRVFNKDLEADSPYNTYKNKGLPVGPICNPGIEAIRGALNPEKHKYLYYHTDETKKDGSHIFTETYDDHKATMNNDAPEGE